MKSVKYLAIFILYSLLSTNRIHGQTECPSPSASMILDWNNVRAHIANGQLVGEDTSTETLISYQVLGEYDVRKLFVDDLWIGGIAANDELRFSGGISAQSSYMPGPLNSIGVLDEISCQFYDRFYVISREMSETHVQYFNAVANGTEGELFPDGYEIPQVLLDYPGSIFTYFNDQGVGPVPQQNYHHAPFFDYNGDYQYHPDDGDCPLFSGMIDDVDCQSCDVLNGDLAIFWIDNDYTFNPFDGEPLSIEIHNTAYVFTGEGAINNTVFYNKKIISKSPEPLDKVYFGLWSDTDLGCSEDDFIAYDVERKMAISYNAESTDCDGQFVYGENPPVIGLIVLDGPDAMDENEMIVEAPVSSFMTFNGDWDYPQKGPETLTEYYNYLSGHWQDGTSLTYGETGYGGTIECKYSYPHDTDPDGIGTNNISQLPWSESSANTNPGDRLFVLNHGPFLFESNTIKCISYAKIYAENDDDINPLNEIQLVADEIKGHFDNCFEEYIINGVDENEPTSFAILDWNHTSKDLHIISNENNEMSVSIFDAQGKMLLQDSFQGEEMYRLNGFSSGMYIVKLVNKSGAIQSEKIMLGN